MNGSWRAASLRTEGVAALVGVALIAAGCGSGSSSHSSAPAATSSSGAGGSSGSSSSLSIGTAKGADGTYLTGASGRALYLWVADSGGKSSCSGACAKTWPPLIVSTMPSASGGVITSDLGTITRLNGSKQVTYKGHPLYYFAGDQGPGKTSGQGSNSFGAKWWLVAPSGSAITASSKTASASTGSSSGSSGSTSGSSSGSGGGGWG